MDNIHIKDSYKIWSIKKMRQIIDSYVHHPGIMNRTYLGFYIEWWIHNICYYLTLPFAWMNGRSKDVDLERH